MAGGVLASSGARSGGTETVAGESGASSASAKRHCVQSPSVAPGGIAAPHSSHRSSGLMGSVRVCLRAIELDELNFPLGRFVRSASIGGEFLPRFVKADQSLESIAPVSRRNAVTLLQGLLALQQEHSRFLHFG